MPYPDRDKTTAKLNGAHTHRVLPSERTLLFVTFNGLRALHDEGAPQRHFTYALNNFCGHLRPTEI